MCICLKVSILLFVLIGIGKDAKAQKENKLVQGTYESGLRVAFDSTEGIITCKLDYNPYEGEKTLIQHSCKLFIKSEIRRGNENLVKIVVYNLADNDSCHGVLKFLTDRIYLKFDKDIASCYSVLDFNSVNGAEFFIEKKRISKRFGFANIEKLKIFDHINDSSTKKYLLKNEIFEIINTQGDWFYIEFVGKKITRGWVKNKFVKS